MNILHVTHNYFPSVGGTQHNMQKISEMLHQVYQDRVTVFTSDSYFSPNRLIYKKISPEEECINGVLVKRFDFLKMHRKPLALTARFSRRVFGKQLPSALQNISYGPYSLPMRKAVVEANADVVCASSINYMFSDYPLWRKNSQKPKPFVLYGALHLNAKTPLPERYFNRIKNCEYYIANTSYEKEFLIKHNIDDEKIKVLGSGTDLYRYRTLLNNDEAARYQFGYKKTDILILYLGRQEGVKNIQLLVDAFFGLKNKYCQIKLIIAGARGSFTDTLLQLTKENNDVKVLTDISEEDKCRILSICDLLILPSTDESFGVVFLEAWSFSKPVIGVNIGAVASVIDHGKNGFLFDPFNLQSLIHCMEIMILDESKRRFFGETGYKKLLSLYTWDIVALGFRNIYQMAIDKFNKAVSAPGK